MNFSTVVLAAWVSLVACAVIGVFLGVLWPTGPASVRAPLSRWSRIIARKRVWILAALMIAGVFSGAISAADRMAEQQQADVNQQATPNDGYGQWYVGRLVDLLYAGVQDMTGETAPEHDDPLASRIARTSGFGVLLLLALELVVQLFHAPVQRLRLRLHADHVVVCGLGRVGRALVDDCTKQGMRVAVVEREGNNSAIAEAVEMGAVVWIGDLTSKRTLRTVGVTRATHVFLASGSDEQNLEAANDLLMVLLEPTPRHWVSRILEPKLHSQNWQPPQVMMHLDRPELGILLPRIASRVDRSAAEVKQHLCNKHSGAKKATIDRRVDEKRRCIGRPNIGAFNVADRSIETLFDTHLLDNRPRALDDSRAEVAHYVIIGFGPVGERLALHLARQAHFENLKRARMTIVHTPDERGRVERFKTQYPAFFPGSDVAAGHSVWSPDPALDDWGFGVRVIDLNNPTENDRGVSFVCNGGFFEDAAGALSPEVTRRLTELSHDDPVVPTVFICDAEDESNCSQAKRLREELDLLLKPRAQHTQDRGRLITVVPHVPARPMLTRLTSAEDGEQAGLIPFGDASDSCTFAKLTKDPEITIATAIHRSFDREFGDPHAPRSWDDLQLWEREANLAPAWHVNAKLSVLNLRMVPADDATDATRQVLPDYSKIPQAHKQTIARMEHNRWMAERLLTGWKLGNKPQVNAPENKRRKDFVHWELLHANDQTKDYKQIEAIMASIESLTTPAGGDQSEFTLVEV